MFPSQYTSCPDCGVAVELCNRFEHQCDPGRYVEYQVCLQRAGIDRFESDLAAYLETPQGQFAVWLAARDHR